MQMAPVALTVEPSMGATVVATIDDIVSKVQSTLGLSLVEVIRQTEEAIFAGTDASGTTILLHAKKRLQAPNGADVMLRTSSPHTIAVIQAQCQNLLSN